ncbi:HupE/UreJ family protein [Algiphilus sp.]|uniref:HupE/UreJ family protein n=1 Tax=Algiphilus sp. TaxID=1872431 RepID=UPI003C5C8FCC
MMAARTVSGLLLCVALLAASWTAAAHAPSDSFLRLDADDATVTGRWDIALRDLHELLTLDADGNGAITWGEVHSSRDRIAATALGALRVTSGAGDCPLESGALRIVEHSDGPYAALALRAECDEAPETLTLDYDLLFDLDAAHRGLLRLDFGGARSAVFSPSEPSVSYERDRVAPGAMFLRYLRQGAWHIWAGLDHLLFLLCLLLPAVLQRQGDGWRAAPDGRTAFVDVLRVVTAFTLAHALSLSAAALDWLQLPSRWVEAGVAATIVFAAANNLVPMVQRRLWMLAFGFGLVHGAGYAGVLAGLGLPTGTLALALLGFNVGVEGGQILIAALFMPLAWLARYTQWYRHGVVVPGSVLAVLVGLWWLLQRLFNVRLEGLW